MTNTTPKTAVVAVGGNVWVPWTNSTRMLASQVSAVEETCKHIADMIERGWNVIVTHGNGPQVGFILRRNELASHEVHHTAGRDRRGHPGRHRLHDRSRAGQ